jgi:hypothetical protein
MNKEDIIRMAREACDQAPREDWNSTAWVFGDETLERFAALVAAHERESCARLCDVLAVHPEYASDITKVAAQAIRARGEQ